MWQDIHHMEISLNSLDFFFSLVCSRSIDSHLHKKNPNIHYSTLSNPHLYLSQTDQKQRQRSSTTTHHHGLLAFAQPKLPTTFTRHSLQRNIQPNSHTSQFSPTSSQNHLHPIKTKQPTTPSVATDLQVKVLLESKKYSKNLFNSVPVQNLFAIKPVCFQGLSFWHIG